MNKVILYVSDKKRENTTISKIRKSLRKYKDYDTVEFKIIDLYNPPQNDDDWKKMTRYLYEITNQISNEGPYMSNKLYIDQKNIKVEIENEIY